MSASKSKINSSDTKRDFREGSKTPVPVLMKEFLHAAYAGSNPEKELRLAQKIGEFNGAYASFQCARAIAGTAFRHASYFGDQTSMLFSHALESASRASWLDTKGVIRHRAEKFKLNLPILAMISEETIPSLDLVRSNLDARIKMIPDLLKTWEGIKSSNDTMARIDTVGHLSEETVGLLMARYVVSNSINNFVPVDAVFSQDSGRLAHSEVRTGWDISIFTDYPVVPSLTHRLQVKTTSRQEEVYFDSDDFSVIPVSDLKIPRERNAYASPQKILQEIHDESEGCGPDARQARAYLDCRTEVLVDIFS